MLTASLLWLVQSMIVPKCMVDRQILLDTREVYDSIRDDTILHVLISSQHHKGHMFPCRYCEKQFNRSDITRRYVNAECHLVKY